MPRRLLLCILAVLLPTSLLSAQDTPPADPAGSTPETANEKPAVELPVLIRTGDLAAARAALTKAIEQNPSDASNQSLRLLLANRLAGDGQMDAAIAEAEALHEFNRKLAGDPQSAGRLVSSTGLLRSLYLRSGNAERVRPLLEQSTSVIRGHVDAGEGGSLLIAFAQLLSLSATQQLMSGEDEAATQMLATECDAMLERMTSANGDYPLLAWSSLMKARISNASRADASSAGDLQAELDERISQAVSASPESLPLMSEFLSMRMSAMSRIVRDDPDTAAQIQQDTLAALDGSSLKENPQLARSVAQLKSFERQINAARKLKEMIGQPAPVFDMLAWAHGEARTQESLIGKVVLLDFWAIWCGPCVATFPHLKEWHEQFHDKGLEIVGVTRRYGYSWDAEAAKAVRGENVADVPLEIELDALDKFMASHELHHATIVTPDNSDMNERYGVTGIPQAVLIDRQGNVRMIKIGSGEANASELRAMIETLIAE